MRAICKRCLKKLLQLTPRKTGWNYVSTWSPLASVFNTVQSSSIDFTKMKSNGVRFIIHLLDLVYTHYKVNVGCGINFHFIQYL